MSNSIQFLEAMGRSSSVRRMSVAEYEAAVDALDIAEPEALALKARDALVLANVLGERSSMICMVWAPDQAPAKEDDDYSDTDVPDEEAPPAQE
mgnify:FL=1